MPINTTAAAVVDNFVLVMGLDEARKVAERHCRDQSARCEACKYFFDKYGASVQQENEVSEKPAAEQLQFQNSPHNEQQVRETEVEQAGRKLIIPSGMSLANAMETLRRRHEEQEAQIEFQAEIDGLPWDVLLAFQREVKDRYDDYQLLDRQVPTMFGTEAVKPQEKELPCGAGGKAIRVQWGTVQFTVHGAKVALQPDFERLIGGRYRVVFHGVTRRKAHAELSRLMDAVRVRAERESIYRGQAIRVTAMEHDYDTGELMLDLMNAPPRFMETPHTDDQLILPGSVKQAIKANIFAPVERTEQCRKLGVPLKRGVLLAGKYGTGKTLTAAITARKCVDNGWTFIYLEDVEALPQALELAKTLQPCVLFAEDIDQALSGDTRDDAVNSVLNTLDGVDSKSHEVLLVLTTNHVERLPGVVLRPGRFDAVIEMLPPDIEATVELLSVYGGHALARGVDLGIVATQLEGQIPAVIREVVERAKLYSIAQGGDGLLTTQALLSAAEGMTAHLSLIEQSAQRQLSQRELEYETLGRALGAAFNPTNGVRKNGASTVAAAATAVVS